MLKKVRFVLAFVSLSICLCLISNTYSRYIADATSNIDAAVAKWQILVNNTDVTSSSSSALTFIPTIEQNENVADNVIAPSSKGYFDIKVDPSNVEVSFNYTINLAIDNVNFPDINFTGYSFVPQNYVEGDPLDITSLEGNVINNTLAFDKNTPSFQFQSFTIRVYFEWYEGENELMDDEADTEVGNLAAVEDTAVTMNANISFAQIIE